MHKIFTATVFALITTAASADTFAPWNERTVNVDRGETRATVAPSGFGPWRDTAAKAERETTEKAYVERNPGSIFRPWS